MVCLRLAGLLLLLTSSSPQPLVVPSELGLNLQATCVNASSTSVFAVRVVNGLSTACGLELSVSAPPGVLLTSTVRSVVLGASSWTDVFVPVDMGAALALAPVPVALAVTATTGCSVTATRASGVVHLTNRATTTSGGVCTWARASTTTVRLAVQEMVWVEAFAEDVPFVVERQADATTSLLDAVNMLGAGWLGGLEPQPGRGGASSTGLFLNATAPHPVPGRDLSVYGGGLAGAIFNTTLFPSSLNRGNVNLTSLALQGWPDTTQWASPLGGGLLWTFGLNYPRLTSLSGVPPVMTSTLVYALPNFASVSWADALPARPGVALTVLGALIPNATTLGQPRTHNNGFLIRAYSAGCDMSTIPDTQEMVQQRAASNGSDYAPGDSTLRLFSTRLGSGVAARCVPFVALPGVGAVNRLGLLTADFSVQRFSRGSKFPGAVSVRVGFAWRGSVSRLLHKDAVAVRWPSHPVPLFWGNTDISTRIVKLTYHRDPWAPFPAGVFTSNETAASVDRLCGDVFLTAARGALDTAVGTVLPGVDEWFRVVQVCLVRTAAVKAQLESAGPAGAAFGPECVAPSPSPSPSATASPSAAPGTANILQVAQVLAVGINVTIGPAVYRSAGARRLRSVVAIDMEGGTGGEGLFRKVPAAAAGEESVVKVIRASLRSADGASVVASLLSSYNASAALSSPVEACTVTDGSSTTLVTPDLWFSRNGSWAKARPSATEPCYALPASVAADALSLVSASVRDGMPRDVVWSLCTPAGLAVELRGKRLVPNSFNPAVDLPRVASRVHNVTLPAVGPLVLPAGTLFPGFVYTVAVTERATMPGGAPSPGGEAEPDLVVGGPMQLRGMVSSSGLSVFVDISGPFLFRSSCIYVNLPPLMGVPSPTFPFSTLLPRQQGDWRDEDIAAQSGVAVSPAYGRALTTLYGLAVSGLFDGEDGCPGATQAGCASVRTSRGGKLSSLTDVFKQLPLSVSDARLSDASSLVVQLALSFPLVSLPSDDQLRGLLQLTTGGAWIVNTTLAEELARRLAACSPDGSTPSLGGAWWSSYASAASSLTDDISLTSPCTPGILQGMGQTLGMIAALAVRAGAIPLPVGLTPSPPPIDRGLTVSFRAVVGDVSGDPRVRACTGQTVDECSAERAAFFARPTNWLGQTVGKSVFLPVAEGVTNAAGLFVAAAGYLPTEPSRLVAVGARPRTTVLAYVTDGDGGVLLMGVTVVVDAYAAPPGSNTTSFVQNVVNDLASSGLAVTNPFAAVQAVEQVTSLLEPTVTANATVEQVEAARSAREQARTSLLSLLSTAVSSLTSGAGAEEPVDDGTATSVAFSLSRITAAPAELSAAAAEGGLNTATALLQLCAVGGGTASDLPPPLPAAVSSAALSTVVNVLSAETVADNATGTASTESRYKASAEAAVTALSDALLRDVPIGGTSAGSPGRRLQTQVIRTITAVAPAGSLVDPTTGCPPGLSVTASRLPLDTGSSVGGDVSVLAVAPSCGSAPAPAQPTVTIPRSAILGHATLRRMLAGSGPGTTLDVRVTSWASSPVTQTGDAADWVGVGVDQANRSGTGARQRRLVGGAGSGRVTDIRPSSGLDTGVLSITLAAPEAATPGARRRRLVALPVSGLSEPITFKIPLRTAATADKNAAVEAYRVRRFSLSCPASTRPAASLGSLVPALAWPQPRGAQPYVPQGVAAYELSNPMLSGATPFDSSGTIVGYKNVSYWAPVYPNAAPGPAARLPTLPGMPTPKMHNFTKAPLRYTSVTVRSLIVRVDCGDPVGEQVVACGGVDENMQPKPVTVFFVCPVPQIVPTCAYWDVDTSSWSSAGCSVVETSPTAITCACDHLTDFGARFSALADQQRDVFAANELLADPDVLNKFPHVFIMVGVTGGIVVVLMWVVVGLDAWGDHKFYLSLLADEEVGLLRLFEESAGRPFVLDRALDKRYKKLLDKHRGILLEKLTSDLFSLVLGGRSVSRRNSLANLMGIKKAKEDTGGALALMDGTGMSAALNSFASSHRPSRRASGAAGPPPVPGESAAPHSMASVAQVLRQTRGARDDMLTEGTRRKALMAIGVTGSAAAAALALQDVAEQRHKSKANSYASAVYLRVATAFDDNRLSLERIMFLTGHTIVPDEQYRAFMHAVHHGEATLPLTSSQSRLGSRRTSENSMEAEEAVVLIQESDDLDKPVPARASKRGSKASSASKALDAVQSGESRGEPFDVSNPMAVERSSTSVKERAEVSAPAPSAAAPGEGKRAKAISAMSPEERTAYYTAKAGEKDKALDDPSPWCCVRTWKLRKLIFFSWWTLVYVDNEYSSVCTRHNIKMNRAKRLALLSTALLTSMFSAAFWYAFRGVEDLEEEDALGTDDYTGGAGGSTPSPSRRRLLAMVLQAGARMLRPRGGDSDTSAAEAGDVNLPTDSPRLTGVVASTPVALPDMDVAELFVVAALASLMQIPIQYVADMLMEWAGHTEFLWRFPALHNELRMRKGVQWMLAKKSKAGLEAEVLSQRFRMGQIEAEHRLKAAAQHAKITGRQPSFEANGSIGNFSGGLVLSDTTEKVAMSFLARAASSRLISTGTVAKAAAMTATLKAHMEADERSDGEDAEEVEPEAVDVDVGDARSKRDAFKTRMSAQDFDKQVEKQEAKEKDAGGYEEPTPAEALLYGWIDPPQACTQYCSAFLACCGRHPRQKRAFMTAAREEDAKRAKAEARLALITATVKAKLAASKVHRKGLWKKVQSAKSALVVAAASAPPTSMADAIKAAVKAHREEGARMFGTEAPAPNTTPGAADSGSSARPDTTTGGTSRASQLLSAANAAKGKEAVRNVSPRSDSPLHSTAVLHAVMAQTALAAPEDAAPGSEPRARSSSAASDESDTDDEDAVLDEEDEDGGAGGMLSDEGKTVNGFIEELVSSEDLGERVVVLAKGAYFGSGFLVGKLFGGKEEEDDTASMTDEELKEVVIRQQVEAEFKSRRLKKKAAKEVEREAVSAHHKRTAMQLFCPCVASASLPSTLQRRAHDDPYKVAQLSERADGRTSSHIRAPPATVCFPRVCGASCMWTRPSFAAYAAVVAWNAWCLYYVLLWGLTQPKETTLDFLQSWLVSLGYSIFIIQPALVLVLVWLSLAVWPTLIPAVLWIPCCATSCARTARAMAAKDGSASLTGRLENLTLIRAAGAASSLTPETAVVAFGASAAVSAVYATLQAISGGRSSDARLSVPMSTDTSISRGPRTARALADTVGTPFVDPLSALDDNEMGTVEERTRLILARYAYTRLTGMEMARRRIFRQRRDAVALNREIDRLGISESIHREKGGAQPLGASTTVRGPKGVATGPAPLTEPKDRLKAMQSFRVAKKAEASEAEPPGAPAAVHFPWLHTPLPSLPPFRVVELATARAIVEYAARHPEEVVRHQHHDSLPGQETHAA